MNENYRLMHLAKMNQVCVCLNVWTQSIDQTKAINYYFSQNETSKFVQPEHNITGSQTCPKEIKKDSKVLLLVSINV